MEEDSGGIPSVWEKIRGAARRRFHQGVERNGSDESRGFSAGKPVYDVGRSDLHPAHWTETTEAGGDAIVREVEEFRSALRAKGHWVI